MPPTQPEGAASFSSRCSRGSAPAPLPRRHPLCWDTVGGEASKKPWWRQQPLCYRPYRESLIPACSISQAASLQCANRGRIGPDVEEKAASMANLPGAWVEDARNLDNTEQLLHSANGVL